MLAALIILALLQPVCFWLGAWVMYRARMNQTPAVQFPHKIEVGGDDGEEQAQKPAYTKGRNIL